MSLPITEGLERARTLNRLGEDEAAKQAYVEVLRQDPRNFTALNELATLAWRAGIDRRRVPPIPRRSRGAPLRGKRDHGTRAAGAREIWDYRRPAVETAINAARRLVECHAGLTRVLSPAG